MRLTPEERNTIRVVVRRRDPKARIFLFGSRTDDAKAGGDIDLLIESQTIDFSGKISLLSEIKEHLGNQKIDIVLSKSIKADTNPFIETIKDQLVEL